MKTKEKVQPWQNPALIERKPKNVDSVKLYSFIIHCPGICQKHDKKFFDVQAHHLDLQLWGVSILLVV